MAEHIDRRRFLTSAGAIGALSLAGSTGWALLGPTGSARAAGDNEEAVLVSIFLRGGADGLHIVCPHGDANYRTQRGALALRRSEFFDLDGFFGLSRDFESLHPFFRQKRMAVVHAVGAPAVNRSHFQAQVLMDYGLGADGWMQRAIATSAFAGTDAGLSIGDRTHPQLFGESRGTTVRTVDQVVESGMNLALIRPAIEQLYDSPAVSSLERDAVADTFAAIDHFSALDDAAGSYPGSSEGQALREAATLIAADIGVRAVAIDSGNWDHHSEGRDRMAGRGQRLSTALDAFMTGLGRHKHRVVVVVTTEFGRTVSPNGANGTDHGWGSVALILGDRLRGHGGGKVITPGGWPGLATADLFDGRDLPATTDFRSVYAELIERHLGVTATDEVFPGLARQPIGLLPIQTIGDVNSSGSVNNADVQALMQQNVSQQAPPPSIGDIDGDGDVDVRDALTLAQQLNSD